MSIELFELLQNISFPILVIIIAGIATIIVLIYTSFVKNETEEQNMSKRHSNKRIEEIKKMIRRESRYWQQAYPEGAKVIEKFGDKLIGELFMWEEEEK